MSSDYSDYGKASDKEKSVNWKDILEKLAHPFKAEQIEWKVQSNPKDPEKDNRYWGFIVPYIDARDVIERLNLVVPGNWKEEYSKPIFSLSDYLGNNNDNIVMTLACTLTIYGYSHFDYGTHTIGRKDTYSFGNADKAVISDALKRAALKFGIGMHIYRYPKLQGVVVSSGKGFRIADETKKDLIEMSNMIQAGKDLSRFKSLRIFTDYQESASLDDLELQQPTNKTLANTDQIPLSTKPIINEQTQEHKKVMARIVQVYYGITSMNPDFKHPKLPNLEALSVMTMDELKEFGNELNATSKTLKEKRALDTLTA